MVFVHINDRLMKTKSKLTLIPPTALHYVTTDESTFLVNIGPGVTQSEYIIIHIVQRPCVYYGLFYVGLVTLGYNHVCDLLPHVAVSHIPVERFSVT